MFKKIRKYKSNHQIWLLNNFNLNLWPRSRDQRSPRFRDFEPEVAENHICKWTICQANEVEFPKHLVIFLISARNPSSRILWELYICMWKIHGLIELLLLYIWWSNGLHFALSHEFCSLIPFSFSYFVFLSIRIASNLSHLNNVKSRSHTLKSTQNKNWVLSWMRIDL